ncbi:MetQ/NlpA family ABC transporter substrate-binding protein [Azospirillum rugosum]|uniref:ABC-type metal ion transport system substrate-binding protein n=1 Tax=Azospirillum rugosum TaxID=416170 RepID=A0ABS4STP8_9PROT|nr:MetQ/NlpA family ABC transporter substrate-binding protein [Azospirillum rugosum]MBP2295827.1 ABC-type metal ion transport system substrate-binding protein [Azospirillum rugosum]MDQ0529062.1 ABC-type metal ion transport system substrate-binding protein [Azospirillum rugosum]
MKAIGELKPGAKIGIPNDPSKGGRALNLLAANGLLTLKDGKGLTPAKDALIQEPRDGNPYGNFVAARAKDKDRPALKTLVSAYQSQEVKDFLQTRFKGAILPAW